MIENSASGVSSPADALEQRLRFLAWAWGALLLLGLAVLAWRGDAPLLESIVRAPWVEAHRGLIAQVTDAVLYPFYVFFFGLMLVGWWRHADFPRHVALGYLLAQLCGSVLTVRVLKVLTGRARPYDIRGPMTAWVWIGPTWKPDYHAFPSGHTADIFTSLIFVALLLPRRWMQLACLAFATAEGMTRITVSAHFPSDVWFGALVGGLASGLTVRYWLLPRLRTSARADAG